MPAEEPRLYILMRDDLDSLNPGKMVAQGVHAGNQFSAWMHRQRGCPTEPHMLALALQWAEEGEDFGTTITLGVDGRILPKIIEFAQKAGFPAKVTHDPTYPLKDGSALHVLPLDTCGFIFGGKEALEPLLRHWGLLP